MKTRSENPGEDGIKAAKEDMRKFSTVRRMVDEYKAFLLDSLQDGSLQIADGASEQEILQAVKEGMEIYFDIANDQLNEES